MSVRTGGGSASSIGRWPTNTILVHHEDCVQVGMRRVKTGTAVRKHGRGGRHFGGAKHGDNPMPDVTFADAEGYEEIPKYQCAVGCPVRALDEQSGQLRSGGSDGFVGDVARNQSLGDKRSMIRPEAVHADEGGASRFFPTFCYAPKVSKQERNAGCDALPERPRAKGQSSNRNDHPTVKPISLMRWLVRLVTPGPGPHVVLDPFMGSGSTGIACIAEGVDFIGVEREPDYYVLARARIEWALGSKVDEATQGQAPERGEAQGQQDLFLR